ncbi:YjgB family protein [Paenibacillus sp. FSL E2-0178]|uniref:YjgB family protein n=1 Tax=Paenibacillus sp. FSL E2-0178 TaxID=2921361 RepID=UPI003158178E
MITSFKTIAGIILLGGMLSLTACNSGKPDAADTGGANTGGAAAQASELPASAQPEGSPAPAAGTEPAEAGGAAATAAPDAGGSAAAASPAAAEPGAAADEASAATPQELSKQLKELLQLAKQGKVPGVEYAAHSGLIDDVEAAWGEPDTKESAGKGIYSTYAGKHVVIGFNKGSQIFDVRSSASDLQKLTLKQIEEVLGKPDATSVNGSDDIYIYQAGKQYQLKFIIPDSTGTVDHISVFSEQDSINNMAG